jgi:5-methyltetrahydropteroyltriglutamate--homocysteine methyltransferase
MIRLPARHDHVGSFLRPTLPARRPANASRCRRDRRRRQLRAVEDRAIAEIVRFQQGGGPQERSPTASFAATYFHIDFLDQLGGVEDRRYPRSRSSVADGTRGTAPRR